MKKISLIMMFVATLAMTSCGLMGSATNTAAVSSGAACGQALIALNNSKNEGDHHNDILLSKPYDEEDFQKEL